MGQERRMSGEAKGAEQSLKEKEDTESKIPTRGQAVLKMVGIKKK